MAILYEVPGSEPTCPSCGNGNAMLHRSMKNLETARREEWYVCRDCGYAIENPEICQATVIPDNYFHNK